MRRVAHRLRGPSSLQIATGCLFAQIEEVADPQHVQDGSLWRPNAAAVGVVHQVRIRQAEVTTAGA